MGSEGAPEFIYSNGLYYQTGTSYIGYDPNTGLNLNTKWEDTQNIWGYDGQDLHYTGLGLQQEYVYPQQEYIYPQTYDSYQPYQFNSALQTENPILGTQIQVQQPYLTNPNYQHQLLLPQTGTELGSMVNPVYQPNYSVTGSQRTSTGSGKMSPSIEFQNGVNNKTQKSPVQNLVQVKQAGTKGATPLNQITNSSAASVKTSSLLEKPTGALQLPPRNWTHPLSSRVKTNSARSITVKSYTSKIQIGDSQGNITINTQDYNKPDFQTEYNCAKFFVIKSYSEDDVHKSIKYGVWSSTPNGNRKLSAAYEDAQRIAARNNNGVKCPIFLFFSVNGSGHFCGVAEMAGPVDFSKDVDLWQQDKWPGSFPVKWQIIKDVPNTTLRQVALENNEFKPVTHSRDTQEVSFVPGTAILKIFKNSNAKDSVLDDFLKYEELERNFHKRRTKLLSSDAPVFVPVSKKDQALAVPEKKSDEDKPTGTVEEPIPVEKKTSPNSAPNGNPNPNPNLVGKEMDEKPVGTTKDVKKQENGNGNPNRNVVLNRNPNPNSVVKKEPAEKLVSTKKDAKKKENGTFIKSINDGNPNIQEKEPGKQVNGTVMKAKSKSEVKENGKVGSIPKDPNESKPLDQMEKVAETIGSLSINSKINKETGGSSAKQGVVTIGSMHVRVNNNNP